MIRLKRTVSIVTLLTLVAGLTSIIPSTATADPTEPRSIIVGHDCDTNLLVFYDWQARKSIGSIYLLNREGFGVAWDAITTMGNLSWVPGHNRILFDSLYGGDRQPGAYNVFDLDLTSGEVTVLTGYPLASPSTPRVTVRGTVRDASGEVVEGATVRAVRTIASATTNQDGAFEMEVPVGEAMLMAFVFDAGSKNAYGSTDTLQIDSDTNVEIRFTERFSGRYGFGQPAPAPDGETFYFTLYGPSLEPDSFPAGRIINSYNINTGEVQQVSPSNQSDLGIATLALSSDGSKLAFQRLMAGVDVVDSDGSNFRSNVINRDQIGLAPTRISWADDRLLGAVTQHDILSPSNPKIWDSQTDTFYSFPNPTNPNFAWGTGVFDFSPDGTKMLIQDGVDVVAVDVVYSGPNDSRPRREINFDCDLSNVGTQSCNSICSATWGTLEVDLSPPEPISPPSAEVTPSWNSAEVSFVVPDDGGDAPLRYEACVGTGTVTDVPSFCARSVWTSFEDRTAPGNRTSVEIENLEPETQYTVLFNGFDALQGAPEWLMVNFTTTEAPDSDGDGVDDFFDNCVDIVNGDQSDSDGDGLGDACDDTDDSAGNSGTGGSGSGGGESGGGGNVVVTGEAPSQDEGGCSTGGGDGRLLPALLLAFGFVIVRLRTRLT